MASSSSYESDEAQLESLYATFGSVCSTKNIALAYLEARHDVEKAGEILCNYNQIYADSLSHDLDFKPCFTRSVESSRTGNHGDSVFIGKTTNGRKVKNIGSSLGTVSSHLGKTYYRPISSSNEPFQTSKPSKDNVPESFVIEKLGFEPVVEENALKNIDKKTSINNTDVEEFLFSMLGDGFRLNMDSIREVLGNCGYNVKQSMDELLSLTAKTLDITDQPVHHDLNEIKKPREETSDYRVESKKPPRQGYSKKPSYLNDERANLSREVLESLFSITDRLEEPKPKRLELGLNRTRVTGEMPVTKPFDDYELSSAPKPESMETQTDSKQDDEDGYLVLRKASKQHWNAMKLYYEAAVDAFTKGDQNMARYCSKEGKHYYQMARAADEKSSDLILEKGKPEEKVKDLPLDLSAPSLTNMIKMLKLHLLNLASIPSFTHLKVTINKDDDNTSKGKRRKDKVVKLLDEKSIHWCEVENSPGIILIQLDEIDPNTLSFEN